MLLRVFRSVIAFGLGFTQWLVLETVHLPLPHTWDRWAVGAANAVVFAAVGLTAGMLLVLLLTAGERRPRWPTAFYMAGAGIVAIVGANALRPIPSGAVPPEELAFWVCFFLSPLLGALIALSLRRRGLGAAHEAGVV